MYLPLCSNTNTSSRPVILQYNRAKEGLFYQAIYELKTQAGQAQVGSGWIIFKCPDWAKFVIMKIWTAITWAVPPGWLYLPGCLPAGCSSAWKQHKKGCDGAPCADKRLLMILYQWSYFCLAIRDTSITWAFSCYEWPFITLSSPAHKENKMFPDGEVFLLW